MYIEKSIQVEILTLAKQGARVADIVQYIRKATGTASPGDGRGVVIAYMKKTFLIPLREASSLGAWIGFEDGDGSITDDQLEGRLGTYLRE